MVRTEMLNRLEKLEIFLIEDQVMVRQAVKELIHKHSTMKVVGEAENSSTALAGIHALKPDLVITDFSIKSGDGMELIQLLQAKFPQCRVIVLSMHDERLYACPAIQSGAKGYVMKEKPITDLLAAIQTVAQGRIYLNPELMHSLVAGKLSRGLDKLPNDTFTKRERQVLELIGQWRRPTEIAHQLRISIKTVDYYRNKIKEKLSLSTTAEVTRYAIEVFGTAQPKPVSGKARAAQASRSSLQAAY